MNAEANRREFLRSAAAPLALAAVPAGAILMPTAVAGPAPEEREAKPYALVVDRTVGRAEFADLMRGTRVVTFHRCRFMDCGRMVVPARRFALIRESEFAGPRLLVHRRGVLSLRECWFADDRFAHTRPVIAHGSPSRMPGPVLAHVERGGFASLMGVYVHCEGFPIPWFIRMATVGVHGQASAEALHA